MDSKLTKAKTVDKGGFANATTRKVSFS